MLSDRHATGRKAKKWKPRVTWRGKLKKKFSLDLDWNTFDRKNWMALTAFCVIRRGKNQTRRRFETPENQKQKPPEYTVLQIFNHNISRKDVNQNAPLSDSICNLPKMVFLQWVSRRLYLSGKFSPDKRTQVEQVRLMIPVEDHKQPWRTRIDLKNER